MFDRLKNGISTVENKHEAGINADTFLDLLVCATLDVVDQNGIEEASKLKVEDPSFFLKKLYSVLSAISGLYGANRKMIPQVGGIIAERFPVLEKEIQEDKKSLSEVSQKIEAFEKKKLEKTAERKKLEVSCAHLHDLEAKNAELEKRITEFKAILSSLDENKVKLKEKYDELDAKFKTFVNIWTGEKDQKLLQDALFIENAISDAKNAKDRLAVLQDTIQGHLSEYQEKLRKIIKASEELTKEKEGTKP